MTIKRTFLALNSSILIAGLFLHLLLWDVDFLLKIERARNGIAGWDAVTGSISAWINIYLIGPTGVWMVMTAIFLLFVVLPIIVRYKYIRIKPTPWLAVHMSVYFFLFMKMLRVF